MAFLFLIVELDSLCVHRIADAFHVVSQERAYVMSEFAKVILESEESQHEFNIAHGAPSFIAERCNAFLKIRILAQFDKERIKPVVNQANRAVTYFLIA